MAVCVYGILNKAKALGVEAKALGVCPSGIWSSGLYQWKETIKSHCVL